MIGIYGSNLPPTRVRRRTAVALLTSVAQSFRSVGQPSDNQPNPDQPVARPDL